MRTPATAAFSLLLLSAACSDTAAEVGVLTAPSRDGWVSDGAFPGFTLIGSLKSKRAHLVDMSGTSVHSWDTPKPPSGMYLTERGTLMRSLDSDEKHPLFRGGGASGRIQELDWDGSVVWDFRWDSEEGFYHHDFAQLPNGNILIIAWDRHTREEALAAGRDPELLEGEELWPDAVYEIQPTRPVGGEVVWSWHAWDHLVQNADPAAPNYGEPADRPERIDVNGDRNPDPPTDEEEATEAARMAAMGYGGGDADDGDTDDGDAGEAHAAGDAPDVTPADEPEEDPEEAAIKKRIKDADWMHTNGIDYNAALDQIALSVRRYDEIWIIDHSTTPEEAAGSTGGRSGKGGDLLYRWGNPFAYGMGQFEDRQLLGQHNVQWIPEGQLGAGNLIVFDNGTKKERAWSTVDEWWAPRDAEGKYLRADGEPFGPPAPDWSYESAEPTDFFSSFISGVQRLPNGNTLVCSGAQGWVFEVTPRGEVVWDWKNPYGINPEVDEPDDDTGSDFNPRALFRAERYAPDHPGIVALRAKGVAIPLDPGTGPATNQYVEPEGDDGDETND